MTRRVKQDSCLSTQSVEKNVIENNTGLKTLHFRTLLRDTQKKRVGYLRNVIG